jgi:hypothetical protein
MVCPVISEFLTWGLVIDILELTRKVIEIGKPQLKEE